MWRSPRLAARTSPDPADRGRRPKPLGDLVSALLCASKWSRDIMQEEPACLSVVEEQGWSLRCCRPQSHKAGKKASARYPSAAWRSFGRDMVSRDSLRRLASSGIPEHPSKSASNEVGASRDGFMCFRFLDKRYWRRKSIKINPTIFVLN